MPEVTPVPLAELTTLRTGGIPDRMIDARTDAELVAVLTELWANGESWLVLGGGSNLFVGDGPKQGAVVRVLTQGIERVDAQRPGYVRLRVAAGHSWDDLVAASVTAGLAGIEAMSGIPGTVGAAPIQNIGAYGQDIAQTLVEVELLDEGADAVVAVPAAELGLGFRTSALKRHYGFEPRRPAVILSVTLELEDVGHGARSIGSGQLRSALGAGAATLGEVREGVLALRRSKGMVLDAEDTDTHGVGSFFQNAIVSASFARTLPPECPRWPLGPDRDEALVIPLDRYTGVVPAPTAQSPDVKVSAAWLIEHAGVRKGFRIPRSRAAVSTKHALALVNRGGATAGEVAELARYIRRRVENEFGLLLHPEPVLIDVEI